MGEKLFGVLLLQLDQPRIVERQPFGPSNLVGVFDAVAHFVGPADVEVQVDIDAAFFEFCDPEIEPVELLGVERTRVVARGVDQPARRRQVEEVQPHAIDAEARQRRRPHRRVLFLRQHRGAAAPIRDVDSPQPQPLPGARHEMAAGDSREAMFSGWRVQQKREIDYRRRATAMIHRKGFHSAIGRERKWK
jgi:hypothetical protein